MEICTIGYNYSHGADFEINRPNGLGCWLFLLIKSPAIFFIEDRKISVKADSFIILRPDISYRYYGSEGFFSNDWVHFNADENDLRFFEKLRIPIDEPVCLGDIAELSESI